MELSKMLTEDLVLANVRALVSYEESEEPGWTENWMTPEEIVELFYEMHQPGFKPNRSELVFWFNNNMDLFCK